MKPADRAWLALASGVAVWDVFGPETLSSAAERYRRRWPWIAPSVIVFFALHLLGAIPERSDPLCLLFQWKRPQP